MKVCARAVQSSGCTTCQSFWKVQKRSFSKLKLPNLPPPPHTFHFLPHFLSLHGFISLFFFYLFYSLFFSLFFLALLPYLLSSFLSFLCHQKQQGNWNELSELQNWGNWAVYKFMNWSIHNSSRRDCNFGIGKAKQKLHSQKGWCKREKQLNSGANCLRRLQQSWTKSLLESSSVFPQKNKIFFHSNGILISNNEFQQNVLNWYGENNKRQENEKDGWIIGKHSAFFSNSAIQPLALSEAAFLLHSVFASVLFSHSAFPFHEFGE